MNVAGTIFVGATLSDKVEVGQNLPPPPPPPPPHPLCRDGFQKLTAGGMAGKVIAMMMHKVQACECDIGVFYNVPRLMAPLNMGGTLRQQQHKVFVQFYLAWWCADLILCGALCKKVLCIGLCLVFSV